MIDLFFVILGLAFLAWMLYEAWQYSERRDRGYRPHRRNRPY